MLFAHFIVLADTFMNTCRVAHKDDANFTPAVFPDYVNSSWAQSSSSRVQIEGVLWRGDVTQWRPCCNYIEHAQLLCHHSQHVVVRPNDDKDWRCEEVFLHLTQHKLSDTMLTLCVWFPAHFVSQVTIFTLYVFQCSSHITTMFVDCI